jgi:hypothetical protein
MDSRGLKAPIDDIESHSLIAYDDFFWFNAFDQVMFPDPSKEHDVEFRAKWAKGHVEGGTFG